MLSKAEAAGMMKAVAEFIRGQVASAMAPIDERLTAVEARQPEKGDKGDPGSKGEDGSPGTDGASVGLDDVMPLIEQTVAAKIADIPVPRDGAPGEKGERGADGPPGKLPVVKSWSDRVHYEGEAVAFDGRTFQALRDTGKAPGHGDWICIAERGIDGRDGCDGRGFAIRGTWSEGEDYAALDVVALNGASFVAKHDNPGPCPGEGWQLFARQGKTGGPGERGRQGEKGERGDAGLPVVAMQVSADGLLTLTNGDGSQVTCDLYPVLAQIGSKS